MTILLYTRRKGWYVESVTIESTHTHVNKIETDAEYEDIIEQQIEIKGDISTDQRDQIKYIAERCPIHRLISKSPAIISQLKVTI